MYLVTTYCVNPKISNLHRVKTIEDVILYLKLLREKEFPDMKMSWFLKGPFFKVYRSELNCPIQDIDEEDMFRIVEELMPLEKEA